MATWLIMLIEILPSVVKLLMALINLIKQLPTSARKEQCAKLSGFVARATTHGDMAMLGSHLDSWRKECRAAVAKHDAQL